MTDIITVHSTEPGREGYCEFMLGGFTFRRDEFFVHINWPTGSHVMSADIFLRAMQRDIAWDFFYGTVNFDAVFGTVNHYGTVDMFGGRFNESYRKAELDHMENFPSDVIRETFKAIIDDWTNSAFDPFASPAETGNPFGVKDGSNTDAVTRRRVAANRTILMVEHNLSVVSKLSDHITVLARGEILAQGNYAAVSTNPDVIQAYLGAGHG